MVSQFSEDENYSVLLWCDSYIVQYTPSPFLPSILHLNWCSLVFFFLFLIKAKDFRTKKIKYKKYKLAPTPHKLWFLPGLQSHWNCWENSAKRKKQLLNCACSKLYWKSDTGYNNAHFLSACHSHTQQRLKPQWDRMVLGVWHNTK